MEIFTADGRRVRGVDPKYQTVGISQIKTHAACPRKWHCSDVQRLPQPTKPHLEKGTAVHKRNELYLTTGEPLDDGTEAGKIAAAGAHLLPAPRSASILGVELTLYRWIPLTGYFSGHFALWRGTIDLLDSDARHLIVVDHKTAASLDFVDTAGDLAADVQTLTYSWAAHTGGYNPRNAPIKMRKNYFPTRGRFTPFAVEAYAYPERLAAVPAMLQDAASRMAVDACRAESDVAQNFDHCSAFGGCPFRSRCHSPQSALDLLFATPQKGKTKVNPTNPPAFDREAFLRNIGQVPTQSAAPAETAPVAPPQSAPVANQNDPFTLKLIGALQENQVRALAAEIIPGTATQPTVQIVEALRTHFRNGADQTFDAWITYARGKFPANAAPINPPESSIAPPVQAVADALNAGAAGRKPRSTAKTETDTEIRGVLRPAGLRDVKALIDSDKAPSTTTEYQALRDALKQGAKPAIGACVNAAAAEYRARGMNAAAVADWIKAGTAPAVQQSTAPVGIPQHVVDGAAARGVELPAAIAPVFDVSGILGTEAAQIRATLAALDDSRFGFLFWNEQPATKRFAAFVAEVRAGAATHRDQCTHELVCDYAGSTAEGAGHGIKTFGAALAHWHSICATHGIDPAALGIPSIPPPAPAAPMSTPPPASPPSSEADPLAGIAQIGAFADAEPTPRLPPNPLIVGNAPAAPVSTPPVVLDRNARIAALFAEIAELFRTPE